MGRRRVKLALTGGLFKTVLGFGLSGGLSCVAGSDQGLGGAWLLGLDYLTKGPVWLV